MACFWGTCKDRAYFRAAWGGCIYTYAWMDSVTEPIWLTLSSRQLQAFLSTACWMRLGFVTVRSSPTTWMPTEPVNFVQFSQSSWSKGSSMDWTGSQRKACEFHTVINKNFFSKHQVHHLIILTWVILDEALVQIAKLVSGDVAFGIVWGFKVQVVFSILVELRGSDVHADDDLIGVAGFLNGWLQQLQSWRSHTDPKIRLDPKILSRTCLSAIQVVIRIHWRCEVCIQPKAKLLLLPVGMVT